MVETHGNDPTATSGAGTDGRLRLRSDVRYRVIDGEALVLCQDRAEILGFNELGTRILALLMAGDSVAQLLTALEAEFAVERTRLEADVAAFLDLLIAEQILEVGELPAQAGGPTRR